MFERFTEHLLLGVLGSGDPPLQIAIRTAGITLDSMRERLVESVGRSRKGPTGHIPFCPSAKQVLERSLQVSKHLGHTGIGASWRWAWFATPGMHQNATLPGAAVAGWRIYWKWSDPC